MMPYRFLHIAILTLALMLGSPSPGFAEAEGHADQFLTAGIQAYRQGRTEHAVQYLNRAIALKPDNANARYYLAISLDHINRPGDALLQYQYVIEHASDAHVVDYAKRRLQTLRQSLPEVASTIPEAGPKAVSTTQKSGEGKSVMVPLKASKNALMVDAAIWNGAQKTSGAFIIDTGATYTSISEAMAESLGLDLSQCERIRITTANGRIEVPKVTIDRLRVNGLEARNIEATVIPIREGSSFSGLLGLSFIRQFILTIDPENHQLIFREP